MVKLKLNNIEIPFVETVKYLGVIIDKKLKFDHHTISVCHKVNYKTIVLKKCAYLFDFGFKTTLFKLFILSSFDYCSTLFFYSSKSHVNSTESSVFRRLEKSYMKSLNKLLNIKLYSTL